MIRVLFTLVLLSLQASAQKKLIDNNSYQSWSVVKKYNISNDGRYAWYMSGPARGNDTLVICRTSGKELKKIANSFNASFTQDNKRVIFNGPNGIAILDIEKDSIFFLNKGRDFELPVGGNGRWLFYHTNDDVNLYDLFTGEETKYTEVRNAKFNNNGSVLLLQTEKGLLCVSTLKKKEKIISHLTTIDNISFDSAGEKIAFVSRYTKGNNINSNSVYIYHPAVDTATLFMSNEILETNNAGFVIANSPIQFSQDGKALFFKCLKIEEIISDSLLITPKVDVWNYKDETLQSAQLAELPLFKKKTFTAVASLDTQKPIVLEDKNRRILGAPRNRYVLTGPIFNGVESYWIKDKKFKYNLVSVDGGICKTIVDTGTFFIRPTISPNEKFVVWYDASAKEYYNYEMSKGIIRNITRAVTETLNNVTVKGSAAQKKTFEIAGWLDKDSSLLIYDEYDIWLVDPLCINPPINITRGYGRKGGIKFRLIKENRNDDLVRITPKDTLTLAAFDTKNKYNGFWKLCFGKDNAPVKAIMSADAYYFPGYTIPDPPYPMKARNATAYLIQKMSATNAPNLFFTADFRHFTRLSDVNPQEQYNWMTTELIRWKAKDGQILEGILYKPEDFDSTKHYPIIFQYYETFSQELYVFKSPGLSQGRLNIPWYVSNGYLVFVPDIHYQRGRTGSSVVNSVVSAAEHIRSFPWVDGQRMGLQGHSFGGYETNYLITHSSMFAAAQEAAGSSDLISCYGGIGFGGQSLAFLHEVGQMNLYSTPWEDPQIYIENSPIFRVDSIKTPLLIMHNKNDEAVPFAQAIELFTAMRRLRKPVWLLQYDGEGHGLGDEACMLDFTIRQQQFFEHFLNYKPAPKWMTQGIPASRKGILSGLEIEK